MLTALLLAIALHFDVQGSGKPVVVLESGFGGSSEAWEKVQPEIAKFARVVSYDRAGLGQSPLGEKPRTAARIVEELRSALIALHLKPPYILVGHSAGAAYVRVFAHRNPKEVAGVILVDPPLEGFLDWLKKNHPEADGMPADRLARMPEGRRAEWDARDAVIDEMRAAWPLPRVPVVLITSAKNDQSTAEVSADAPAALLAARNDFLRHVPNARQIVAEKAGHNIPFDEPELIVDAVRRVADSRASTVR